MNLVNRIDKIKESSHAASSFFYQGKIAEGYNEVGKLINELLKLIDEIEKQEELKVRNAISLQEMSRILVEIVTAMKNEDMVLVADMIQYDLEEILGNLVE